MAGRDSHANADKTLYMKLLRFMSTMPVFSKKQKKIKKEIEKLQKRLDKKEDTKREYRGSDKHSDLYTDENQGHDTWIRFTDRASAKQSINKIKGS